MSSWITLYLRFKNFKGPIWYGLLNVASITLNFGRPHLGKNILEPPIFGMFSLFLVSTHSENLTNLAVTV